MKSENSFEWTKILTRKELGLSETLWFCKYEVTFDSELQIQVHLL